MKKLLSILLVLVSMISLVDMVDAKEFIVYDRFNLDNKEYNLYEYFYKFKNNYLVIEGNYTSGDPHIFNSKFEPVKMGLPHMMDSKMYGDYLYYYNIYEDLFYVIDSEGNIIKSKNLGEYGTSCNFAINDGVINVIFNEYDSSLGKTIYTNVLLNTNLEVISANEINFNYYILDIFYSNDILYAVDGYSLYKVNDDFSLEVVYEIPIEYDNSFNFVTVTDDYMFLSYIKDLSVGSRTLVMFDGTGKKLWEKDFYSSLVGGFNFDNNTDVKKLDNGNYLFSIGSLYEIDSKGNIVNQCKKCTFNGTADVVGGKYKGLGFGLKNVYDYSNTSPVDSQLITLGESVKLEVKEAANGRVRVSRKTPRAGEEVVITLRPQIYYGLDELNVVTNSKKNVEVTKISDKKYSFIMPEEDTSIKVTYKKK